MARHSTRQRDRDANAKDTPGDGTEGGAAGTAPGEGDRTGSRVAGPPTEASDRTEALRPPRQILTNQIRAGLGELQLKYGHVMQSSEAPDVSLEEG